MNIFCMLVLVIISTLSFTKSQRISYENVEANSEREVKPSNEKVYFPGKTNEFEVNLKRLNNVLTNSDMDFRDQQAAARREFNSVISSLREGVAAVSVSSSNEKSNDIVDNSSSSARRRVINRKPNLSKEDDERRTISFTSSSGNRKFSQHSSSEESDERKKILLLSASNNEKANDASDNSFSSGRRRVINRKPNLSREDDKRISISFTSSSANRRNSQDSSSEESDERKKIRLLSASNRRNPIESTTEEPQRIPPPSIVDAATPPSNLRVCEIKYAQFIQRVFPHESDTAYDANDAEFNGRILAAPGQYPHMTAIGFYSIGRIAYKCGGSLISETFVITAAHCTNFTGLQPTKVRIGDLNLLVEESYLEPQLIEIKNIYVHPKYRADSYYNDIALLQLREEVQLTEFVRPIRLWTEPTIPVTTAHAMGYGATDFARARTNRLTKLNMTIVPNDECNREMPELPETKRGIISSQICSRDYKLNRDTCQGDSGGPLQLNVRGRRSQNRLHYQLIGITSYGLYCRSGYPSIFTRVYSYLDWIERIVWRDYFQ